MENFHTHDRGYKYLFSNPILLKELLESFVRMDWVKKVDFSKAESLNTSFVSDEFKNRQSDIIYRLKLRDQDIYLYLLIEFQSTVDRFMALRMLRYTLELYDYLIKNRKLKELPVVFPVMLYNGKAGWTAAESFSQLIKLPEELKSLKKYVPEFGYFSIIENRYSNRELNKLGNIVSSIFLLENQDKDKFLSAIETIKNNLDGKDISAVRIFLVWLKKYLEVNASIEEAQKGIRTIKTSKEAKSMLAETIKELKKDWFKEGVQQGVQQGVQKGIVDGKKAIAKAMKKEGIDLNTIAKVTGFSLAVVKKL